MKKYSYDLEERLINFAVMINQFVEKLPSTKTANHLGGQLIRSGTSPALNYGEAQGAEFTQDFLHKVRVCLKELRESQISLKIISKAGLSPEAVNSPLPKECGELVAIFTAIVKSTKDNLNNPKKPLDE
ncbi:MAG: four helix bundle protein [Saprospirales bacterium]|nr:four helix bundle protein [Saprospirales bacterium]